MDGGQLIPWHIRKGTAGLTAGAGDRGDVREVGDGVVLFHAIGQG
jgi:hypothetical protein